MPEGTLLSIFLVSGASCGSGSVAGVTEMMGFGGITAEPVGGVCDASADEIRGAIGVDAAGAVTVGAAASVAGAAVTEAVSPAAGASA